jgi:outer membrane protein assembly factor BamA
MKKKLVIHLFLVLYCSFGISQTIIDVKFEGLKKTNIDYLERFLDQKKDSKYDSTVLKKDIQNLRNLNLFYEIECITKDSLNGIVITIVPPIIRTADVLI